MPDTPPIIWARIVVIMLSVPITLFLLRNNQIPLHQSLNFVLSPLNYFGSSTMLFGMNICSFYTVASANATNISSMYPVISSKAFSLVILNNSNHFDNTSILFPQC